MSPNHFPPKRPFAMMLIFVTHLSFIEGYFLRVKPCQNSSQIWAKRTWHMLLILFSLLIISITEWNHVLLRDAHAKTLHWSDYPAMVDLPPAFLATNRFGICSLGFFPVTVIITIIVCLMPAFMSLTKVAIFSLL